MFSEREVGVAARVLANIVRPRQFSAQPGGSGIEHLVAMFNKGDTYFEQLAQWRPPRMPRPKIIDGRRERTWSEHEIKVILGELFAPKRDDEQAAIARYRIGRKVQFSLLNGLRHSEMNPIPNTGIDWAARQVRIRQAKTGNYKMIGPLGPTSIEILREFYNESKTDLVFSQSGNISPKFYRILREACESVGVPYGRGTPDGLVLHDQLSFLCEPAFLGMSKLTALMGKRLMTVELRAGTEYLPGIY